MQTFLPYANFRESAKCLDNKRLGKQRVEGMQILKALLGYYNKTGAWINHPATKQWRGYEGALVDYVYAICDEWIMRGYKDSVKDKVADMVREHKISYSVGNIRPKWLGNRVFHKSHKSNLIRKDEGHYKKYWPSVPADLEYVWPTKDF